MNGGVDGDLNEGVDGCVDGGVVVVLVWRSAAAAVCSSAALAAPSEHHVYTAINSSIHTRMHISIHASIHTIIPCAHLTLGRSGRLLLRSFSRARRLVRLLAHSFRRHRLALRRRLRGRGAKGLGDVAVARASADVWGRGGMRYGADCLGVKGGVQGPADSFHPRYVWRCHRLARRLLCQLRRFDL